MFKWSLIELMEETESKILLVDDEENILRSVEKSLLRAGFDVETAGGNVAALQLVREAARDDEPFALAIIDLNMPDFHGKESKYAGLELLERLKIEVPDMPIIANSAWDEVETAKRCIDKGAADYFVKGRNNEMLRKIRLVLGSSD